MIWKTRQKMISLIIPCFNEEESLPLFYPEATSVLRQMNCDYELIFVNDGSRDRTLEILKELSEKVGITQTVKDVGGKMEDIPMLADKAMEDPCKPGNPREVTKEDFIKLYEEAM
jgi:alcohol dehydrogenase class IV